MTGTRPRRVVLLAVLVAVPAAARARDPAAAPAPPPPKVEGSGEFAFRLDNTLARVAKINTILSLKVSNVIRYANAPVEGFETTDTVTSVALVAKF